MRLTQNRKMRMTLTPRTERLRKAALAIVGSTDDLERYHDLAYKLGALHHLPARWLRACLVNGLSTTPALEYAREFSKGSDWILVLSGDTGTGKSVAACWWATNVGAGWISAQELADSRVRYDLEIHRPALVIDDLGEENLTQAALAKISAAINERYQHRHKTVITTNLTAPTFAVRYQRRIADRIDDGGGFMHIPGGSMRGTIEVDTSAYARAADRAQAIGTLQHSIDGDAVLDAITALELDLVAVDARAATIDAEEHERSERIATLVGRIGGRAHGQN